MASSMVSAAWRKRFLKRRIFPVGTERQGMSYRIRHSHKLLRSPYPADIASVAFPMLETKSCSQGAGRRRAWWSGWLLRQRGGAEPYSPPTWQAQIIVERGTDLGPRSVLDLHPRRLVQGADGRRRLHARWRSSRRRRGSSWNQDRSRRRRSAP